MAHWLRNDLGYTQKYGGLWWEGKYKPLNAMPKIDISVLKEIQIFQIKNKNFKYQKEIDTLNTFIDELNRSFLSKHPGEEDFFASFLKTINKGLVLNKNKPIKEIIEIKNYQEDISYFLDFIANYSYRNIPDYVLSSLDSVIKSLENNEVNSKNYILKKAQLWEDIAQWILSLSGFDATNTGPMIDRIGEQLIQDTYGELKKSISPSGNKNINNIISFGIRVTGEKSKKANLELLKDYLKKNYPKYQDNLPFDKNNYIQIALDTDIQGFDNFIRQTQHTIGRSITVKINDDFQERMKQGLSIQAKSGVTQDLLNNSDRDLVDVKKWDYYLRLLSDFNDIADNGKNIESESLGAYANFIFSRNITQTTLGKNQVFLSHYGFSTLDKYMEKENFYFQLYETPNTLAKIAAGNFAIKEKKG